MMAHRAKDKVLIEAYQNNADLHQLTADNVSKSAGLHVLRKVGKTLNFSILFGMGAASLAKRLNSAMKEDVTEGKMLERDYQKNKITDKAAQKMIDGFYSGYYGFKARVNKVTSSAKARGFSSTLGNRIRWIPELKSRSTFFAGQRYAVSTDIQGSAADLVKLGMLRVYQDLLKADIPAKMILQVHDEVILEVPKKFAKRTKEIAQYAMEHAVKDFLVPLICDMDIYNDWGELKNGKKKQSIINEVILL
jgi:DNA polymerase-1